MSKFVAIVNKWRVTQEFNTGAHRRCIDKRGERYSTSR